MANRIFGLILLLLALVGLWALRDSSPLVRLAAASIGMIWAIKLAAFFWQRSENRKPHSILSAFLFLFAWPGVSLQGFTQRTAEPPPETGTRFLESWLCFLAGIVTLGGVSLIGGGTSTVLNYIGLFSILLIVHMGLVELMADGIRLLGFSPQSLFDRPYLASSLREFWSHRWNRAFVDMNKIFLVHPLRNKAPASLLVFSIFVISGLLHELGISYSDHLSWGKPLLYFVWQGLGMELEKHKKFPRFLVWFWILVPVPLLFTPAFTNLFVGGLSAYIFNFGHSISKNQFLYGSLIFGGLAHFLVICASVQVPGKLGWRKDFQKLLPLNRKVFWTYGGYIFSIILFMSLVSFVLAKTESLYSVAALLWTAFIALFWWARVLTDFFYFSHDDWPKGPLFTVGHICLTTLFISLAVLYTLITVMAAGWI